jgi:hypothetical protein
MTKTNKVKEALKKLSDAELFVLAADYESGKKIENEGKKKASKAQKLITDELIRRKTKALENEGTKITLVQNESVVYDGDGLWDDLTPKQRRLAFDEDVNLNGLSVETRKKIREIIPKEELAAVTTRRLNVDNLSVAVQEDKIDAKTVAKRASIVKSAPYIRVSHGSG